MLTRMTLVVIGLGMLALIIIRGISIETIERLKATGQVNSYLKLLVALLVVLGLSVVK